MSDLSKFKDKKGQSFPHLYIDEVKGEFWALIRVGKRVRKRNLKTLKYFEAIAKLPIALAELGDESYSKQAKKNSADKLLSDYWQDLRAQKVAEETSEATLTRFDSIWNNNLEPYFKNWKPSDVSADMMPAFINWHRKHKPGAQFVNVFKYLSNLMNYMVRVGALPIQQTPEIKLPKSEKKHHDKKKGRIITDEERVELLSNGSPRMRLLSGLADILGNRKMELVSLQKDRLKWEGKACFIELTEDDTKTGLPRILPVPSHLLDSVKLQILSSGESAYLFPAARDSKTHVSSQVIDNDWREQKKLAKIKGRLKFHDWRHTRATKMAVAKINPILACTILGMTIAVYQKKYVKLSGQDLIETVQEIVQSEAA